jgi:hypothetical protein
MIEPTFISAAEGHIHLEITLIGAKACLYYKVFDTAQKHPNPHQFLIDHILYWGRGADHIIRFLIADDQHFRDSPLLDVLYDRAMHGASALLCDYEAIAKATLYPDLKGKAEEMLKKMIDNHPQALVEAINHSFPAPSKFLKRCIKALDRNIACSCQRLCTKWKSKDLKQRYKKYLKRWPEPHI